MEVDLLLTKEGFACHRKASFELALPKDNAEEEYRESGWGEG